MPRHTALADLRAVPISRVRFTGGFWAQRQAVNTRRTLPIEYEQCKTTGRLDAFKLEWKPGLGTEPPHIFWDSDVAKWIEAVAYSLLSHPDGKLERLTDGVIEMIAAAQQPDGYLNTHYIVAEKDKRWSNLRDNHELYCAGHMIEAAVAYFEATGKRKLLDTVARYADHIAAVFGTGDGQKRGYCGHEEIELALVKLGRVTGEKRFLDLATYFVDERGRQNPHYFDVEARARGEDEKKYWAKTYAYCQAHAPVRELREVAGHAVRAMYLYCAMADLAGLLGDRSLRKACERLWDDLVKKKLYITGGIGPSAHNEGFTVDYDLPNESAYAETCAAVGLAFWAHRMAHLDADGRYTDMLERCLYNGTISGVSLDGERFFYVNPLESRGKHHRQEWFGCACCPPNIARLVASVNGYVYSTASDARGKPVLLTHLYGECDATVTLAGHQVRVLQHTQYPWDGYVRLTLGLAGSELDATVAVRIPAWCRGASLSVNGKTVKLKSVTDRGYAYIARVWNDGDVIELVMPMPIERIEARPEVRSDCGRIALQRGPVVYCLESADNGANLADVALQRGDEIKAKFEPRLLGGVVTLNGKAQRRDASRFGDDLYAPRRERVERVAIKAVPYFAWDNRKAGEMVVWIQER